MKPINYPTSVNNYWQEIRKLVRIPAQMVVPESGSQYLDPPCIFGIELLAKFDRDELGQELTFRPNLSKIKIIPCLVS